MVEEFASPMRVWYADGAWHAERLPRCTACTAMLCLHGGGPDACPVSAV